MAWSSRSDSERRYASIIFPMGVERSAAHHRGEHGYFVVTGIVLLTGEFDEPHGTPFILEALFEEGGLGALPRPIEALNHNKCAAGLALWHSGRRKTESEGTKMEECERWERRVRDRQGRVQPFRSVRSAGLFSCSGRSPAPALSTTTTLYSCFPACHSAVLEYSPSSTRTRFRLHCMLARRCRSTHACRRLVPVSILGLLAEIALDLHREDRSRQKMRNRTRS